MFLRSGFHHIKIFTQYDGRRNEGYCSQNKTRFISCWIVSNYGVRALANEGGPLACFGERGHESRWHFWLVEQLLASENTASYSFLRILKPWRREIYSEFS
jgi:hypothetical protein